MNLKIKEICDLLNVSEKTVYRWIQANKIPYYKINHQYRFNKAEINEWILRNNMPVTDQILKLKTTEIPVSIHDLIQQGGICYEVEGHNLPEVFRNALPVMHLPEEINPQKLLATLMEREELMPTSMGNGIAFPHPRSPIITDVTKESISLVFIKNPISYFSTDNQSIHTLFIILSANPKRHLEILSKLSFTCQDPDFLEMLTKREKSETIFSFILRKEIEWNEKMRRTHD